MKNVLNLQLTRDQKRLRILFVLTLLVLGLEFKAFAQETKNPLITGTILAGVFSHYVAPMGYVVGKGPHNQTCLELNAAGFKLFGWSDYDFGAEGMNELDLGIKYSKKIKYTSADIGITYWNYPLVGHDYISYINLAHDKKIKKEISLIYLVKDKNNRNGFCLKARVSKKFDYSHGLSSDFGISSAYVWDFYGDTGFSNITPGANFNWNKKYINLTLSTNYQIGFINKTKVLPPIKNQLYESLNLSVDF
jgi:hypothetical protein